MNNLKKYTEKDRQGNMFSFEFDVPSMQEIPKPEGVDPTIFKPKGTDTVPAMLTPGENVVNAEASRLYQPMIDKMNNEGRAIQKNQGGPIPTYQANGGVIIDDKILDGMMQVESGGNPNAVSEAGAIGPMQIMPSTAQNPGYGVKPISLEDLKDPTLSKDFARRYMQKLADNNPQLNVDEIKTAYHSGLGNVLKARSGEEALGPRGQAYANKVNAAMEDPDNLFGVKKRKVGTIDTNNDAVPELEYDGRSIPSTFMSANAATDPSIEEPVDQDMYAGMNPRQVQRFELGIDDDIIMDSGGNVQAVNPNRVAKDIPQKLAEQFAKDGNRKGYDYYLNDYKKALKQDKAHKDYLENKNREVDLNKNEEISIQVSQIDSQIEKAKADGDDTLVQVLIKKKEKIEKGKVEIKATEDQVAAANETKKKAAQDISNQLANEEDIDQTVMNNEEVNQYLIDNPGKSATDKFIDKAKEYGGVVVDKSMEYFKNAFSSMFNGEELARMAMIYAGSRVMGYDHGGSLNYSMKNYIKRVDANLAYAKKAVLDKDFAAKYSPASLIKYAKTGDMSDLIPLSAGASMTQTSGSAYLRGVGKVQKYKDANGVEYVGIGGKYVPVTQVSQFLEPWDESVQGDKAVQTQFSQYAEEAMKMGNEKFGLKQVKGKNPSDTRASINTKRIGLEANRVYRDIIRKNSLSVNDTLDMRTSISTAIDNYTSDQASWVYNGKQKGEEPISLEAYINEQTRIPLTGVDVSLFGKTKPANLNALDKIIRSEMELKDTRNPKFQAEYKESWGLNQDSWAGLDGNIRAKWEKRAADKKGWSGFTLWASRTSAEEKAQTIN